MSDFSRAEDIEDLKYFSPENETNPPVCFNPLDYEENNKIIHNLNDSIKSENLIFDEKREDDVRFIAR